ncbi:MAG: metallophosphoesterase [Aggregatilineales bacterium]
MTDSRLYPQVPLPPSLSVTARGWHWVPSTLLRFGLAVGATVVTSGLGLWWYASRIEPRWIDWRRRTIPIDGLPPAFDGYRLIQLSDLHLAEGKHLTPAHVARIVVRVNRLRPDAIAITGDLVSRVDAVSREGIGRLAKLRAPDGVFAVPGNHDYWSGFPAVHEAVQRAGLHWLVNAHHLIRRNGAGLTIAGVDDAWEGAPDLAQALRGVPSNAPVILLAHTPNFADVSVYDSRIVLQLSGHSHGGQVRIPGFGPIVLPDQAWRFPVGLYRANSAEKNGRALWVYTNRGLGLAEVPMRFNCRPEVTIFTLRSSGTKRLQ